MRARAAAFLLLAGIKYPRIAAGAGAVYIVGRQLFAASYASGGPDARLAGTLLLDAALVALFGLSAWTGATVAGVPALLGF